MCSNTKIQIAPNRTVVTPENVCVAEQKVGIWVEAEVKPDEDFKSCILSSPEQMAS